MATTGSDEKEMTIKIAHIDPKKRFSLFKFNQSLGTDVTNWARDDTEVQLLREDNSVIYENSELEQSYGAGSEFGRAQRHIARSKKYGRRIKTYQIDNQPWMLNVEGRAENRRYRGMKEGGAGEHSDYWVFRKQNDGTMEAIKLTDWYQFLPLPKYKPLDAEQAEEEFAKRNKVVNQFALKAQLRLKQDADEAGSSVDTKPGLKISDRDEYKSDNEEDEEGAADDTEATGAGKKSKAKKKKGKSSPERNADDVAKVESDDGDEEGLEQDYMSDSGSGEDDDEPATKEDKEKHASLEGNQLAEAEGEREDELGVADQGEEGDSEDSDMEDVDDEDSKEAADKKPDVNEAFKKRMGADAEEKASDESESDSDDPDNKEVKSAFFLPNKNVDGLVAGSSKRPSSRGSNSGASPAKRAKTQSPLTLSESPTPSNSGANSVSNTISEGEVRRLLLRRPFSTKQLLNKFKKSTSLNKDEIVGKLAEILKEIKPKQSKKKEDGKNVLYFSLDS